jgi:hypothetical protein
MWFGLPSGSDGPPVQESSRDGAVEKPEDAGAFRIPAGVRRRGGRSSIKGGHVVINGGDIGLEPAAKMQPWGIEVTQAITSRARLEPR